MGSKKANNLVDTSLFEKARQAVDRVTLPRDRAVLPEPTASRKTQDALIRVAGLEKTYINGAGGIPVIRDVHLDVYQGEIVAITGPSGCGKSTLLFILGLFLSPTQGTYHFGGEDVLCLGRSAQAEFRRRRVGFVFQTADLLENTTVDIYTLTLFPDLYGLLKRFPGPFSALFC